MSLASIKSLTGLIKVAIAGQDPKAALRELQSMFGNKLFQEAIGAIKSNSVTPDQPAKKPYTQWFGVPTEQLEFQGLKVNEIRIGLAQAIQEHINTLKQSKNEIRGKLLGALSARGELQDARSQLLNTLNQPGIQLQNLLNARAEALDVIPTFLPDNLTNNEALKLEDRTEWMYEFLEASEFEYSEIQQQNTTYTFFLITNGRQEQFVVGINDIIGKPTIVVAHKNIDGLPDLELEQINSILELPLKEALKCHGARKLHNQPAGKAQFIQRCARYFLDLAYFFESHRLIYPKPEQTLTNRTYLETLRRNENPKGDLEELLEAAQNPLLKKIIVDNYQRVMGTYDTLDPKSDVLKTYLKSLTLRGTHPDLPEMTTNAFSRLCLSIFNIYSLYPKAQNPRTLVQSDLDIISEEVSQMDASSLEFIIAHTFYKRMYLAFNQGDTARTQYYFERLEFVLEKIEENLDIVKLMDQVIPLDATKGNYEFLTATQSLDRTEIISEIRFQLKKINNFTAKSHGTTFKTKLFKELSSKIQTLATKQSMSDDKLRALLEGLYLVDLKYLRNTSLVRLLLLTVDSDPELETLEYEYEFILENIFISEGEIDKNTAILSRIISRDLFYLYQLTNQVAFLYWGSVIYDVSSGTHIIRRNNDMFEHLINELLWNLKSFAKQ